MNHTKIKRNLHYYQFKLIFKDSFVANDGDTFREFFSAIALLAETKNPERYQQISDRYIFMQNVRFIPGKKIITGLLRCVRKDLLPEIMSTTTDEAKGIELLDHEGIVETTHFIIDYSLPVRKLSIEFNFYGAKFNDFIVYIDRLGAHFNAIETFGWNPVVRNNLPLMIQRMRKCSEMIVTVHKENIDEIQDISTGLFTVINAVRDQFNPEYATVTLKYDYKKIPNTNEANNIVGQVINAIRKNPRKIELFNKFQIRAEDSENKLKLAMFDLLLDKVQSNVIVEKIPNYRILVSADIIDKMQNEMIRLGI